MIEDMKKLTPAIVVKTPTATLTAKPPSISAASHSSTTQTSVHQAMILNSTWGRSNMTQMYFSLCDGQVISSFDSLVHHLEKVQLQVLQVTRVEYFCGGYRSVPLETRSYHGGCGRRTKWKVTLRMSQGIPRTQFTAALVLCLMMRQRKVYICVLSFTNQRRGRKMWEGYLEALCLLLRIIVWFLYRVKWAPFQCTLILIV